MKENQLNQELNKYGVFLYRIAIDIWTTQIPPIVETSTIISILVCTAVLSSLWSLLFDTNIYLRRKPTKTL